MATSPVNGVLQRSQSVCEGHGAGRTRWVPPRTTISPELPPFASFADRRASVSGGGEPTFAEPTANGEVAPIPVVRETESG